MRPVGGDGVGEGASATGSLFVSTMIKRSSYGASVDILKRRISIRGLHQTFEVSRANQQNEPILVRVGKKSLSYGIRKSSHGDEQRQTATIITSVELAKEIPQVFGADVLTRPVFAFYENILAFFLPKRIG